MATDPVRRPDGPHSRAVGARTAELFEAHSRMVFGLCRVLLRDPHDAEDATQATFVSAYRALLARSTVRDPAAWLATIARNECRARIHDRMREPLPLLERDLVAVDVVDCRVDRLVTNDGLRRALACLPDKQREAVVLRDLYGLRYDEVGAALGASVAAVESLLFRARRSLRVSLKTLSGGALTLPIALREGIAQALPGFGEAAGAGTAGGVTLGAVGGGLLTKLVATPVASKVAAAVVAVGAAGIAGGDRVPDRSPASARAESAPARTSAEQTPPGPTSAEQPPRTDSGDIPQQPVAVVGWRESDDDRSHRGGRAAGVVADGDHGDPDDDSASRPADANPGRHGGSGKEGGESGESQRDAETAPVEPVSEEAQADPAGPDHDEPVEQPELAAERPGRSGPGNGISVDEPEADQSGSSGDGRHADEELDEA